MKDQIAKALADLMKSKSYKSISIQMICKEASISRNTFYYHFKGKQELLEWICVRNYQKYCFPFHRFEESVLSSITIFDYIRKEPGFL